MLKASLLLAGCLVVCGFSAGNDVVRAPSVPDNLKVPEGQSAFLEVSGEGVQIYTCQSAAPGAGKFGWTFKAPEAVLKDSTGQFVGKHYAGPTWESSDGSKIVGQVVEQAPAPAPASIPWLLLKTKSTEGMGMLANVTYVQRVDTEGGKAPSTGCDSNNSGAETRAPYRAHYYFYRAAH